MTAAPLATPSQPPPTSDQSSQKHVASPKPSTLSRSEEDQVAALLNINNIILREIQKLQTSGAAAQTTQPSPQQKEAPVNTPDSARESQKSPTGAAQTPTSTTPTPQTPKATKPSPKQIYDNFLKRVQLNIAYLLAVSQGRNIPSHPPVMEPPPVLWFIPGPGETASDDAEHVGRQSFGQLNEAYQKLKTLFPTYRGPVRHTQQAGGQQPQAQQATEGSQKASSPGQSTLQGFAKPQSPPQQESQSNQEQQAAHSGSQTAQPQSEANSRPSIP